VAFRSGLNQQNRKGALDEELERALSRIHRFLTHVEAAMMGESIRSRCMNKRRKNIAS
jgi:hypothetical protein